MRINFSSGQVVEEVVLGDVLGFFRKEITANMEILSVGLKDKMVCLFGVSRSGKQTEIKKFLIHPSNEGLPKNDFEYYWYLGTIAGRGWHIFEVV